ncbi:hypothetical protein ANCDUO_04565 [Ancylostoma duodenale]|uniref:Translation initiation factor eIF2B subunit gamma n=1 Tax=Ancylostoma duodenale TaxID=51022 RepID=A0A0C2DQW4_9BILA|nr:hypothetical protein ANCDUO_04565 [Ancylostoma duodenale]
MFRWSFVVQEQAERLSSPFDIDERFIRDFVVMSCDFITDARLQPMIDQFRAHNATFLCLLSDMCATGPVPGPKVRRGKGRDFVALEESTSRIVYMTSEEDFDQPVNAESWMNKHIFKCESDGAVCRLSRVFHATFLPWHDCKTKILKCLPRISSKLYTGQVFDGRATGIHTNESLVAKSAQVGARALIKRSVVGSRCSIGERANIQGSVIMEDSSIGKGAKITQSIICSGVVVGDNAELSSVIVTKDQRISANGNDFPPGRAALIVD